MARAWPAKDVAPLIALIDEPGHGLAEDGTYRLSEIQAKAILDLRLQRLTGLEREKIGEELRVEGTNEDELERARKPLMNMLEEYRRDNSYWMDSVLASSQEFPERLDWARSIIDDYGTASVAEVNELAAKYLGEKKALRVLIVSEDAETSG